MHKIADYTLVRPLEEGNHGAFYLAEAPPRLGLDVRHVVVKLIARADSDDGFRRATRELRLFASVQSPFLVRLYDAGQDGDTLYYSMEHLPLGSLSTAAPTLDRAATLRALAHAARAAHALHEAGVVHRDITPANIMLHARGARLADLGMAQLLATNVTVTGMGPLRSIEFIDPACIRGERASRASDIWSLGTVTHRVLVGEGVYGELPTEDPLLALRRVLGSPPSLAPSLSQDEADLVRACLSPEPADRPLTALAVAERMEELSAECTRQATPMERAQRRPRPPSCLVDACQVAKNAAPAVRQQHPGADQVNGGVAQAEIPEVEYPGQATVGDEQVGRVEVFMDPDLRF